MCIMHATLQGALQGCADSGAAASTETDIETETETETEAPRIIRMIDCSNFGVRTRNYCWVASNPAEFGSHPRQLSEGFVYTSTYV